MSSTKIRLEAAHCQKLKDEIEQSIKANRRTIYEECRKQMQKQKIKALLTIENPSRLDVHNASLTAIQAAVKLFDQKMKNNNEFADIILPKLKQAQAQIYRQSEQYKKEKAYQKILNDHRARIQKKKPQQQNEAEVKEQAIIERKKQSKQTSQTKNIDNKEQVLPQPKKEQNLPEKKEQSQNTLNIPVFKQDVNKQEKKQQTSLFFQEQNPISIINSQPSKPSLSFNDAIPTKKPQPTEKLVPLSKNGEQVQQTNPFKNPPSKTDNPFTTNTNNIFSKPVGLPNLFSIKSNDNAPVENNCASLFGNNKSSSIFGESVEKKRCLLGLAASNSQGQSTDLQKGESGGSRGSLFGFGTSPEDNVKSSFNFSPPACKK